MHKSSSGTQAVDDSGLQRKTRAAAFPSSWHHELPFKTEHKDCVTAKGAASHWRSQWYSLRNAVWFLRCLFIFFPNASFYQLDLQQPMDLVWFYSVTARLQRASQVRWQRTSRAELEDWRRKQNAPISTPRLQICTTKNSTRGTNKHVEELYGNLSTTFRISLLLCREAPRSLVVPMKAFRGYQQEDEERAWGCPNWTSIQKRSTTRTLHWNRDRNLGLQLKKNISLLADNSK